MISQNQKAKLIWNCRRGMLELDLILNQFLSEHLDDLTREEFINFEQLLDNSDPQLYSWLMGHEVPEDKEIASIVDHIRIHHRS